MNADNVAMYWSEMDRSIQQQKRIYLVIVHSECKAHFGTNVRPTILADRYARPVDNDATMTKGSMTCTR